MTKNNEPRIGVFVCDCGSNIASVVDVPQVVEYSSKLPYVVYTDEGRWSCSVDALQSMQQAIQNEELNRVVIASCTPRTHEPLFKQSVKDAGLNPYLLEFVSIREQVSWVHMREPEKATEKAKDLVKMGVAKAALLEEGQEIKLPVGTESLIIGGGMSGMAAALRIADQGFQAIVVEKQPELGGYLNDINSVVHESERYSAQELLSTQREKVMSHPNIRVYTQSAVNAVSGYVGKYTAEIKSLIDDSTDSIQASTIIVATGMKEIEPEGWYSYGQNPQVITQLELEKKLKSDAVGSENNVVMVNCVNSKNETRGCCSIGCPVSIKNALALKEKNPEMSVHILYRDLSMVKEEHFLIDAAKEAGVKFLRFPDEHYPEMHKDDGAMQIKVHDILLDRDITIPCDLLVLTTAFQGCEDVADLRGLLKVSTNQDGFFQESHVKLHPLDFASDGLALCGSAKAPKNLKECIEEGMGAAMRASIPMNKGFIEAEGIVAHIDTTQCDNCGLCYKRCPYSAIQVEDETPVVIQGLCKGCGLCAADCPNEAIDIIHYSDAQIMAQIEAALEENADQKIVAFVCHWCCLGGVDLAGVSRMQYPTNARLIRVMCSARVSIKFIMRAYELGAAGVLVGGCEFPTCHYITGNYAADKRLNRARKRLDKKGYDPEKLWTIWCSAADAPKFAGTMKQMVKELDLA